MRRYNAIVEYQVQETPAPENDNEILVAIKARSFNPVDYYGRIELNDFEGMEPVDRIELRSEHTFPIGYADNIHLTEDYGLEMTGHIFKDMPDNKGMDEYIILKNHIPREASIGFEVVEAEEVEAGAVAQVNNIDVKGPVCVYRRWKLREVSLCSFGADDSTESTPINLAKKGHKMPLKKRSTPENDPEKKTDVQCEDEVVTTEESDAGAADLATIADQVAQLTEIVNGLIEKINQIESMAEEDPTETEDAPPEKPEDKKEELSKKIDKIQVSINKMYSAFQASLGASPIPIRPAESDVKQYASPWEEIAAMEAAKLK